MFRRKFRFGVNPAVPYAVSAGCSDLYEPGKGYGFVTEKNKRQQELLQISELNAGWDALYWLGGQDISLPEQDSSGVFLDSDRELFALEKKAGERMEGEKRRIPLCFKTNVPRHGNYRVTLVIETPGRMDDVLIFTGRRRLEWRGSIPAGGRLSHTMIVNVCDIVPRGKEQLYEDLTLDLSVVADKPRMTSLLVEEVSCPTVYIAGDSTVTDQSGLYPYAPGTTYCGWGQMLTAYLDDRVSVSNHAHSGLTTESFRSEGHYAVVDQGRRPGDYLLIQFGHNDQKIDSLKAREGYRENLLRYISECMEKQNFPILVTPVARNSWKGNGEGYNDLLDEYARVCQEVGEQTGTPVLDLHRLSMEFIKEKGLEGAKPYFYPGDFTHSNDYGAYLMANFVAKELVRVCRNSKVPSYRFLAGCVTEGFGAWEPAEKICLPKKPALYEEIQDPSGGAELFSDLEHPEEPLRRADALDMIIRTARFFPTNVYNDMYDDVAGHEWYAGAVECAYQNGIIPPQLVSEKHIYPERQVTLEEFLMFAMNGYQSRKQLPRTDQSPYDGKCHDYARPYVDGAFAIGLLPADGSADLSHRMDRGEAAALCKAMNI
ncbi:MAG: GDSL-type esterase/lipase family protein [Eubacteriales bacterium]|nr:GDSL-type esterase/lipase family protein [Eubacteriales bacterium]